MSLADLKQAVEELLGPILATRSAYLVDTRVRSERGGKLVQVFVDTDQGITIEECANISRDLNRALAQQQVVTGAYSLEVSSPGIDKPLRLLRQYHKNVGRKYKVRYKTESDALSLIGTLTEVSGDRLTFAPEQGESLTLSFLQIIESQEELPW